LAGTARQPPETEHCAKDAPTGAAVSANTGTAPQLQVLATSRPASSWRQWTGAKQALDFSKRWIGSAVARPSGLKTAQRRKRCRPSEGPGEDSCCVQAERRAPEQRPRVLSQPSATADGGTALQRRPWFGQQERAPGRSRNDASDDEPSWRQRRRCSNGEGPCEAPRRPSRDGYRRRWPKRKTARPAAQAAVDRPAARSSSNRRTPASSSKDFQNWAELAQGHKASSRPTTAAGVGVEAACLSRSWQEAAQARTSPRSLAMRAPPAPWSRQVGWRRSPGSEKPARTRQEAAHRRLAVLLESG